MAKRECARFLSIPQTRRRRRRRRRKKCEIILVYVFVYKYTSLSRLDVIAYWRRKRVGLCGEEKNLTRDILWYPIDPTIKRIACETELIVL
jgi:hypothetical protein